jgi:multimeric flavodoxin WrbA
MSKRILVIRGSAREDGYTNRLCNQIPSICKDCTVEYFDTYEETVKPCTGCNYCEGRGKCVYRRVSYDLEKAKSRLHLLKGLEKLVFELSNTELEYNFGFDLL